MKTQLILLLPILALGGCAQTHMESERIDVHNTVPEVCGDAPGLNACRDVDGETFEQELNVDTTPDLDSNANLERDAEKLKKEPIEKEIEHLEKQESQLD